jgi:hypothetical protein
MSNWLQYIVMALLALTLSGPLMAQEHAVSLKEGEEAAAATETEALSPEQQALKLEIESRLSQFSDDFTQLQLVGSLTLAPDPKLGITKNFVDVLDQRMNTYNQRYNSLDVMWTTYTQAQQMDIANDEDLMTMVANIEALKQNVKDTLDAKTQMVKAISDFADADEFIISQVAVYKKLYKRAFKLSLLKKLAPQLEKAKARELLIFQKLQASHDAAKAATELVPSLQPRMNVLDEQFVVMKSVSEKVQALEYKPLIQRVKDYLMGLAAVAIILLFLSMIIARYKAYKDKLASLKKVNEMMSKQGKDTQYPMI